VTAFYSEAEELLLAEPIHLRRPEAICDRWDCDRTATMLTPGCALCHECSAEFGLGGSGRYRVPISELASNEEWRSARTNWYVELVRLHPIERNPERDRRLERAVGFRVDELLRDA
jgi:hypothetical protein